MRRRKSKSKGEAQKARVFPWSSHLNRTGTKNCPAEAGLYKCQNGRGTACRAPAWCRVTSKRVDMECGILLPLSGLAACCPPRARQRAGAPKAAASCRTPQFAPTSTILLSYSCGTLTHPCGVVARPIKRRARSWQRSRHFQEPALPLLWVPVP